MATTTATATTTIAAANLVIAAWWLRPRQRLRPRLQRVGEWVSAACGLRASNRTNARLPRLNGGLVATTTATAATTTAAAQRRLGGYDHGNGYDHECCGSTTAAITTLAMVTIAAAMASIAEPMGVLDRAPSPHRELY